MASRSVPSESSNERGSGKKRPPRPVFPASLNSSLPEIRKSTADDSGTTRRHTPSSVPRVKPSSKSQPEWAKLSQKISFEENSPPSSIRSTPAATWSAAPRSKTTPSRPDPPAVASGYSPTQQEEEDKELKTSVSISDILSRLETVRKYIKDALAIQAKLQEHPDEPGSETQLQLSKLSILIEQLHQQEGSYLNILLSIMGDASENDVESALADKQEEEEDEDEDDEEEEDDEEDDEESSDDGNDSLSLQAEMAWQLEQRKREKETALKEMQALKEQHALLTKLLEQQSQLETLERKQVGLLAQQKEAEDQLSYLNAERKSSPGKLQQNKLPKQQQKPSPQKSETARSPGEVKLMAARAEKAQLDDLLAVVRAQKSSGRQAAGGVRESPLTKTALPPPSASPGRSGPQMVTSVPQASYKQPQRDEVVVDEGTITEAEMQAKMKMVEEARSRLHELQDLLSVLQLSSSQSPAGIKQQQHEESEASKQRSDGGAEDRSSMRPTLKTAEATEAGYASSQVVSVDSLDTSDKNAPTGLDQSLLEEYEQRVQQRQRELQALRQEREELIQLDAMLQDLMVTQEQESSSKVTQQPSSDKREQIMAELERQKQLKEELIKKTHRLQQLKGALSKHKNVSAQDDSTFYGVDTTAATWGGSTVVSESSLVLDEDGHRLASAPDAAIASGSTMYSSATYTKPSPDLPQYRVDRHTPRANRAQRRSFSSPEDQAPSTGKKIKLEAAGSETASHREPRGDPSRHQALGASNFSAAWPSVIFSSHTATKRAEEEETGENEEVEENEQPPNLDQQQQSRPPPIPPLPPSASSYTELLHHQLSSTTVMCSELLQNHGSLLQALHQQLNALPYIQDQLIWLNQYYDNLRNYHQYLADAFAQVSNMSADGTIPAGTNGMEDATPPMAGPRRKDTHEDPLASARGGQGGNDHDFLLPPPPSSWPASFPPSWSSSQQQSPFMFNPTGFPNVSPYLSPYRPGAGQWWGMDPARGRPASRQGYTFGSNATGVGVESVAGASVRAQPPSVTSAPSVSSWQAPPTTVQTGGQASPPRQQPVIPEITVRQPANMFDIPLSSQSGAAPNTSTQQGARAYGVLLPEAAADTESQSSIPISLPEDHLPSKGEVPDDEYSVFDTLRDTIYSEVAAVIAGNEGRPHFLVELFRELQLLKTDYLRQRALFLIQDLVTKYLTDEAVQALGQEWLESGTTTEDDEGFIGTVTGATPRLDRGNSGTFDYTEPVESASSVSTPVEPFASDALGDTVIRAKSPASNKPTTKHTQNSIAQHNTSQSDVMDEEIESESLDEEIKAIMMEVIPLLKSNLEEHCTIEFLQSIQECVMTVILQREEPQAEEKEDVQEALDVFARQLEASLIATLGKYEGKHTKECGEDLLVDVSEVLFREMAFFKLIKKPMSPHSQDFRSVTSNSQTTTDAESYTSSPLRPLVGSKGAVAQSPASSVVRSLLEEEEGLGKSRDDELAKTWDNSKEEPASSESDQEDQFVVVTASDAKLSESDVDGENSDSAEKVPLVSVTLSGEGATAPAMEGGGDDGPPVSQQLVTTANGERQALTNIPLTANGERQALTNIPLADLEAQMNREQASTEGVAAAALEVTDPLQELAGTGEELPSQVSSSEP